MKLICLLVFVICTVLVLSTDTGSVDEDSLFIDINYQMFSPKVLQSNDSWILVFHKSAISEELKNFATEIRGLSWIGSVDITKSTELLLEMKLSAENVPVARVYPFGGINQKLSQWQDVSTLDEARRFALKSIPADIPVLKRNGIEQFIAESHLADIPQYPTVYLTESREISPVFRAIRERFRLYFNLGYILEPTATQLVKMGFHKNNLPTLPALAVIIKERVKNDKKRTKPQKTKQKDKKTVTDEPTPKFVNKAIPYLKEKFGEFSYPSIMQFFFSVNHQFRYTLPEGRSKDSKVSAMMSDIMDIEDDRFDELFGRKEILKSQKAENKGRTENVNSKKNPGEKPENGGKCPFGFDKMGKDRPTQKPNLKKEEL